MSSVDPMKRLVKDFPEMLSLAWKNGLPDRFALPEGRIRLFCGMGGSGMAGSLAALVLAEQGRLGLRWDQPEIPSWITPDDRIVVISYSGRTWEALGMLDCAIARGLPVRVVASGGPIAERCRRSDIPLFSVPAGMAPRASLPYLLIGTLRAVGGMKVREIEEAVTLLTAERDRPPEGRDPARIAGQIEGRLPVFLPVGPRMKVVAERWRNQILENAEQAAFVAPLPEMAHNEIMGWPWLSEAKIPVSLFVLIESLPPPEPYDSLIAALEREAARNGHPIERIAPHRSTGFASLLTEIYLADRVSVALAERRGIAPTPVGAIERLKSALGAGK